jgi:hypothetical protein
VTTSAAQDMKILQQWVADRYMTVIFLTIDRATDLPEGIALPRLNRPNVWGAHSIWVAVQSIGKLAMQRNALTLTVLAALLTASCESTKKNSVPEKDLIPPIHTEYSNRIYSAEAALRPAEGQGCSVL